MTIFTYSLIAFIVVSVLAFLDSDKRRFYYFAAFVIIAGVSLSLWGFKNTSITAEDYFRISTEIYAFEPRAEAESIGVRTAVGDLYISSSYLSKQDREKLLSVELTSNQAVIWLGREGSSNIKGFKMTSIELDPVKIAAIDSEFYRRLINVGIIVACVGLFLFVLNYFDLKSQRRL